MEEAEGVWSATESYPEQAWLAPPGKYLRTVSAGWMPLATAARGKGGQRAWSLEGTSAEVDAVMIMRDECFSSVHPRLPSGCMGPCPCSGEGGDAVSVKHTDAGINACDIMIERTAQVEYLKYPVPPWMGGL